MTDKALIAAFLVGDEHAFESLVHRYRTRIHATATRITRNPEDAEEVVQDVVWTLYRKLHQWQGKAKFSSWLFHIARNAALMKLRATWYQREVVRHMTLEPDEQPRWNPGATDLRVEETELRERFAWALGKVREDYRQVLMLHIGGLNHQQTATILGLTDSAEKARHHRGMVEFRERFKRTA